MNFLFKKLFLAKGEQMPFTGEYIDFVYGRNLLFNFYLSGTLSGNNRIDLQLKNPFFGNDDGIVFYTITGLNDGYATPLFSDSPISQTRIIGSGIGYLWAAVNVQN